MKLLLLSDSNSVHTIKWATSLAKSGIDIIIFSLAELSVKDYDNIKNINIKTLGEILSRDESTLSKLKYLKALSAIKEIIKEFQPDILHAHYASSYGLLGALSGFSPFVLSVWGSDVFSFPLKSPLHKFILKYNLKKADKILSTSHVMAKETKLYTNKEIEVTPFGVDMEQFKPMEVKSLFEKDNIVIGTLKALETKYGIEYLIRAFKIVSEKYSNLPLKLLIVGGGSLELELKQLVKDLKIDNKTIFTGKIPFVEVPIYHNMLSLFVSVSQSESFGVAIIEASSCAKPVVVSNVGGLPEVVEDGVSGFVVPPKNPQETAEAIEKLALDKNLRERIGKNGRERVKNLYNWSDNVRQMIGIYEELLK
ncbi:Glycosyl transferase, group 1 [Sulfurimonas denitrificans DSM 1251]|uniref:Glycosyl transferase, group 1 n=1 Tax=Sulfurimonas denitrificans (strain ATCC 33889 / DSM 1251) TaxID=326298 RepID=Q30QN5_SULDN|nr:glycosyltransferase [Sulfurimonas denitrificans]ABB44696.1 Glycosyl transferase, group 1 [Sulfurimonas denitrificans DSM 1251]MDD3442826.1 glycosyltransferase [Sulfurimonas denitrificans]